MNMGKTKVDADKELLASLDDLAALAAKNIDQAKAELMRLVSEMDFHAEGSVTAFCTGEENANIIKMLRAQGADIRYIGDTEAKSVLTAYNRSC
jgi:formylmethanofuran dehydrogenase subunit E-like metal-binding protein